MLTKEEIARYHDQGFLPGRRLFSPEEAARLRADCERCCGEPMKLGARRAISETRQASNRVKPYLLFPWAAKLVRDPRILDLVEQLIGPDILLFHTTVWLKEPHSPNFVPWHQDGTYFGLAPFDHITAWVALTPATPENGCMRMIPRSQQHGQLAHADNVNPIVMLSRGQTLKDTVDEAKAVDITLQPGEVAFHNTMTVHASGPNRTDDRRIGFGISYIPTHVRHVTPTRLTATLVRGTDRYGHFDPEPTPSAELDDAAVAAHEDAQRRYFKASESIPEMAHIH